MPEVTPWQTRNFSIVHSCRCKDNEEGTKKKLASNVFVKGDMYFRTGDLLKKDARGFFHFVDVTEVMSVFKNVEECNVYGVQIPNNEDGRAPMCASGGVGRTGPNWFGGTRSRTIVYVRGVSVRG